MPLHHIIQHDINTQILIWKITETLHELQTQVVLKPSTVDRISTMKSEIHKRAFLAVRKLLQEINLSDANTSSGFELILVILFNLPIFFFTDKRLPIP